MRAWPLLLTLALGCPSSEPWQPYPEVAPEAGGAASYKDAVDKARGLAPGANPFAPPQSQPARAVVELDERVRCAEAAWVDAPARVDELRSKLLERANLSPEQHADLLERMQWDKGKKGKLGALRQAARASVCKDGQPDHLSRLLVGLEQGEVPRPQLQVSQAQLLLAAEAECVRAGLAAEPELAERVVQQLLGDHALTPGALEAGVAALRDGAEVDRDAVCPGGQMTDRHRELARKLR